MKPVFAAFAAALACSAAQAEPLLCEKLGEFCGEIAQPACLNAVGAGAIATDSAATSDLCASIMENYRNCLLLVAEGCGPSEAADGSAQNDRSDPGEQSASLVGRWIGSVTCKDNRGWSVTFDGPEQVGDGAAGEWSYSGSNKGSTPARLIRDLQDETGETVLLITDGGAYDYRLKQVSADKLSGAAIQKSCQIALSR